MRLPCQVVTAGQASRFPAGPNDETLTVNIHNATGALTTQTREDFSHRCQSCGVGFLERRQLLQHIRATHDGTRYNCPQCQRSCVSKNVLNEHVKLVQEKFVRYRCETCVKGYSRRAHYHDTITSPRTLLSS